MSQSAKKNFHVRKKKQIKCSGNWDYLKTLMIMKLTGIILQGASYFSFEHRARVRQPSKGEARKFQKQG